MKTTLLAISIPATAFANMTGLTQDSGWAGAGLLGMVLAWLMLKHLPEKDRQSQEKDKLILSIVTNHLKAEKEQRAEFVTALKDERMEFSRMLRDVMETSSGSKTHDSLPFAAGRVRVEGQRGNESGPRTDRQQRQQPAGDGDG